ncbi:hypothetical protein ACFE04_023073 [Oxalis oulophora]
MEDVYEFRMLLHFVAGVVKGKEIKIVAVSKNQATTHQSTRSCIGIQVLTIESRLNVNSSIAVQVRVITFDPKSIEGHWNGADVESERPTVAKEATSNVFASYNTKRQEFDIEYENVVEKLLTNMEFND